MADFSFSFNYLFPIYHNCSFVPPFLLSFWCSTYFLVQSTLTLYPWVPHMWIQPTWIKIFEAGSVLEYGTHRYGRLTKDMNLPRFWCSWGSWRPGIKHPWTLKDDCILFFSYIDFQLYFSVPSFKYLLFWWLQHESLSYHSLLSNNNTS